MKESLTDIECTILEESGFEISWYNEDKTIKYSYMVINDELVQIFKEDGLYWITSSSPSAHNMEFENIDELLKYYYQ